MDVNTDKNDKKGRPFLLSFLAVIIVIGLSFVPWGNLTHGWIKNYDLLSELRLDTLKEIASNEIIDPLLSKEMADAEAKGVVTKFKADSLFCLIDEKNMRDDSTEVVLEIIENLSPRHQGKMVIEDYTANQKGLEHLKEALARRSARIAMIGDSYIEGDILTQDIRSQLQSTYGGRGVGYVPAWSQVSGFRGTVRQTSNESAWRHHGVQKASSSPHFTLMGEYFIGVDGATITYKGNSKDRRLEKWKQSKVLFIAPSNGKITLMADGDTLVFNVNASKDVQAVTMLAETSELKIKNNVPGLVFLGAYLEDTDGVNVDCMSLRGYSGISHRKMNVELAEQMRQFVDYDLIIVEYGINALSASQRNYSRYGELMVEVVNRIRECYPNADVLLLGIGDRGQKVGGEVHSLPTASFMVEAQRNAAREAGCLFWDMREAMGGDDAIVDWRNRRLVSGDYIHLNSEGGRTMATELVGSIRRNIGG